MSDDARFGGEEAEEVAHPNAGPLEVRPILRYVPKRWGSERWLANTPDYCGKLLLLKRGCGTSLHYHERKHETFYVLEGLLRVRLGSRMQRAELLLPTQAMELPPRTPHRLENAGDETLVVLEISTHHDDADSFRLSFLGEEPSGGA